MDFLARPEPSVARRAGIQSEVLFGLSLVMVLATAVLSLVLVVHYEAALRDVLGRALWAEARSPAGLQRSLVPGTEWWVVSAAGRVAPRGPISGVIDASSRELGARARAEGVPLLQPGPVWEPMRFAAPIDAEGTVVVGRLPRGASLELRLSGLGVAGVVLLADVLIFTAFGAYLLRRRVVLPLQRLAAAARHVGDGASGTRVPVEGVREAAELAASFNEMADGLERRTAAIEKAVIDLRAANRELRTARAGLDRAERLAAVGSLAAGVAHEVGNPIGAILALLDLVSRDPGLGDASRTHLERAGREGERVRRILRQLLDFSRPPRPVPGPVDVGAVAEEAVALVSAQRRFERVEFAVRREGRPPTARADSSAVAQILLNLLLNAGDAVAEAEAPRVEIRVRPGFLGRRDGDDGDAPPPRRTPDAVECLVMDNGTGISEEARERIFDPFFTTKPPGEGTGLGLANSARLAEELEGSVEWQPPPEGHATAFVLRLPALTGDAASADAATRGAEDR